MNNQKIDLLRLFSGWKIGDWVYCLHCGCCYQVGEYLEAEGLQMCPYPGCGGDTILDSYHWEDIKKIHNDYPEIPERSKIYLL